MGWVGRAIKAILEEAGLDTVLNVTFLCAGVYNIEPVTVTKKHRVSVLRAFNGRLAGWYLDTSFRPARISHCTNPQRVWAVQISPHGVLWAETELAGLTKTKVRVRYHGDLVLLDRERIAFGVTYWRGVVFTSRRHGAVAYLFDQEWQRRYPAEQAASMPIDKACAVLGVGASEYTHEAVLVAFRKRVKKAHPDKGGSSEAFQTLYAARQRLLTALGIDAPREPKFTAPKGVKIIYRSARRTRNTQQPERHTGPVLIDPRTLPR